MTTPARQERSGKKPSAFADFYNSTAISLHNAQEKLFGNFYTNLGDNIRPSASAAYRSVKEMRAAQQRNDQMKLGYIAMQIFNQAHDALYPSAAAESAPKPGLLARLTDTGSDFARAAAGASIAGLAVNAARRAFAVLEERHANPAPQLRPEGL